MQRLLAVTRHVSATPVTTSVPERWLSSAVSSTNDSRKGFRAWVVDSERGKIKQRELKTFFGGPSQLPRQDPQGSVTVRVHFSDLNYKDAMILRGDHGVVKQFPIVPGIDLAGVVESSDSPLWKPGDEVVLTGNKIGQHFDGGYSELCRVQAEWLVRRPANLSLEDCMVIGTAGFTAMQMVMHLEESGAFSRNYAGRPILVTGAAGGVGGAAVALLAKLGHRVVASSTRASELGSYLIDSLGAAETMGRLEGDGRKAPLQSQHWAAAVDTVGGATLASAVAQTAHLGSVACVGVAAGGKLDTTVYPFVLRGVSLLGVDSTLPWNVAGLDQDPKYWEANRQRRLEIWDRLGRDMPRKALQALHAATISMEELPAWSEQLLSGAVRGRVVVQVSEAGT